MECKVSNTLPEVETETCPHCGFTLEDFKKTRRLGCTRCYESFRFCLETILRDIHKGMQHIGKVPVQQMEQHSLIRELNEIETMLQKAISTENYETAGKLRDQLKELHLKICPDTTKHFPFI